MADPKKEQPMAKTVIGILENADEAKKAVEELLQSGIDRQAVGVISADFAKEAEAALRGGSTGTAIGALAGLLIGATTLAIPGIGPVLAAGHAVALIGTTTLGALAGGVVGALAAKGVPEDQANFYAEGVRRGGTLVTVLARTDELAARAVEILRRHGAQRIQERILEWRGLGWGGLLRRARKGEPAKAENKASRQAPRPQPQPEAPREAPPTPPVKAEPHPVLAAGEREAIEIEPGVPFAAVEVYAIEIEMPEEYAGPERRAKQGEYRGEERRKAA
jgi:hypothetical protein